jgi:bacillithiol system protein YtxJ
MQKLTQVDSDEILKAVMQADRAVLYKHSSRCPISANVYQEVINFAGKNPDIQVYLLQVIEQHSLSDKIAEQTGVQHKSPQVIVLHKGQPVWHASHYKITVSAMQEHI